MSIVSLEDILGAGVFFIVGVLVLMKSRNIAKLSRLQKIRLWGEAKRDDASELIARTLVQIVGLVFILGSLFQVFLTFIK